MNDIDTNRPEVTDTLELARRINYSTDIVTDLTDVVQEELPKKSLQGTSEEATNTAILDAIHHIDIDTTNLAKEDTLVQGLSGIQSAIQNIDLTNVAQESTLVQGISGIIDKIETTQPDLSTVAKEETLVQGITAIRNDISNIDIDMSAIAKQGSDPDTNITNIASDLSDVKSNVQGITGFATETNATANKEEIIQAINDIAVDLTPVTDKLDELDEKIDTNTQTILDAIAEIDVTPITDEHIESLFPEIEE